VEWAAVRVVARRDARGDLGNDGDEGQRVVEVIVFLDPSKLSQTKWISSCKARHSHPQLELLYCRRELKKSAIDIPFARFVLLCESPQP
jgi:hypothetical protein